MDMTLNPKFTEDFIMHDNGQKTTFVLVMDLAMEYYLCAYKTFLDDDRTSEDNARLDVIDKVLSSEEIYEDIVEFAKHVYRDDNELGADDLTSMFIHDLEGLKLKSIGKEGYEHFVPRVKSFKLQA